MPQDQLDSPASVVPNNLSQNDILEALKDDVLEDETETEETEPESTKEESGEDDEKPESDSEDEIELKDEDEFKDDELEYQEVPNRAKILKEFPEIFKKFPGIERAIYREDQYTKIFPSIAEAQSAKENLDNFQALEGELLSGSIKGILSSVKQSDPKAFDKIGSNILREIAAVDQQTYYNTVNSVLQHAINTAFTAGKEAGGEDGEQLQIAAQLINKYLYGTPNVKAPQSKNEEEKPDPRAEELNQRERQFNERQLGMAVNDVQQRINSTVRNAVTKYIDPRGLMGDYVKNKAISDVINAVDREINQDSRFKMHLDNLWRECIKNGFDDNSKSRIREAVIKRAQSILPGHIKNVRANAIKGLRSNPARRKTEEAEERRPEANRRQAAPQNNRSPEKPRRSFGSARAIEDFLKD